jgi:Skp family chaperone for outer membrane proteins
MLLRTLIFTGMLGISMFCLAPVSIAADPPAPAAAPAAAAKDLPYLVVDVQLVIGYSKVGKSVAQQLKEKGAEYQKSLDKAHAELQQEINEFNQQVGAHLLNAEAAKKKETELEGKDRARRERERLISNAFQEASDSSEKEILKKIVGIVDDLAKEKGTNLVLQRNQLVKFDPSRDITEAVLKKLDDDLPTLTVNFVPPVAAATPTPSSSAPAPAPAPKKKKQ